MWKHLSYRQFKDFFGVLGLTAWVKFNWLAEVPEGYLSIKLGDIAYSAWNYDSTNKYFYTAAIIPDMKIVPTTDIANIHCIGLTTKARDFILDSANRDVDKILCAGNNEATFIIRVLAYTSVSAFREATSDWIVFYEKA